MWWYGLNRGAASSWQFEHSSSVSERGEPPERGQEDSLHSVCPLFRDFTIVYILPQVLINLSRCVLVHLQSRMEGWDERYTLIGDIFLDLVYLSFLLLYFGGSLIGGSTVYTKIIVIVSGTPYEGFHQLCCPSYCRSTGKNTLYNPSCNMSHKTILCA